MRAGRSIPVIPRAEGAAALCFNGCGEMPAGAIDGILEPERAGGLDIWDFRHDEASTRRVQVLKRRAMLSQWVSEAATSVCLNNLVALHGQAVIHDDIARTLGVAVF
jgi:hypothetical protein